MLLDKASDVKWQSPMTMGRAWYYSSKEEKADSYKSSTMLIHHLCDVVSKNGNFLLNIGPKPDGTIPEGMQKRLLAIGEWLTLNGEAIYGTRPYVTFEQKAPNIRFTTKGDVLYAIMLEQSEEPFVIQIDPKDGLQTVTEVSLLGSDKPLQWKVVKNGIRVTPPKEWPGKHAWTFKIRMSLLMAVEYRATGMNIHPIIPALERLMENTFSPISPTAANPFLTVNASACRLQVRH
jgi:hypothetical protein